MGKYIYSVIAACLFLNVGAQVTITGQLTGKGSREISFVYPQDAIYGIQNFSTTTTSLAGSFTASLDITEERPVWLYYSSAVSKDSPNNVMFYLWLKPDTTLAITLPNDSTIFYDDGATEENKLLKEIKLNSWSIPVKYETDTFSFTRLSIRVDSLRRWRLGVFESAINRHAFSSAFINFVRTEIEYSDNKDKLQYIVEFGQAHNLTYPKIEVTADFSQFISGFNFLSDSSFYSLKYRNCLIAYFDYVATMAQMNPGESYTLHIFRIIDQTLPHNPRTGEFIKAYYLKTGFSFEENVDSLQAALNLFTTISTNRRYLAYFDKAIKGKSRSLFSGSGLPDITLEDTSGNKVSLSSLKGKVVMLDFWGSWCAPCMDEMKYSLRLQNAFKNENVCFVYINNPTDTKQKWKQTIRNLNLGGLQLKADENTQAELNTYYVFSVFPYYVLTGIDGRALNVEGGIRPSSNAEALISKLLEAK